MEEENQNERSLRNIEVSNTRKEFLNKDNNLIEKNISFKSKNKRTWPKIVAFFGIIIFIFIFISIFFHRADVEILQKNEFIIFSNETYLASVEKIETQLEVLETKDLLAEGKIKIFNDTSKDMILKEGTRFQIDDLVFKTYKKVDISSKGTTIVDIYATETGEKYSIKEDDRLNIPGFEEAKMTNEYENIYGEVEEDFVLKEKGEVDTKVSESDENPENLLVMKYSVFESTAIEQKTIPSIGIEEVSEKSSGKIKIINDTSKTQKLVQLTRFENDGLVFKIPKSVTILPKSFTIVTILASEEGGDYNIEKGLKFNIPGFKEAGMTNEYENIYGESETDFTGGKITKENVPNKNELEEATKELTLKIEEALANQIREFVFDKSLLIKLDERNIEYTFENISKDNEVIVKATGREKIAFIYKDDFIQTALQSSEITEEDLKNVEVKDIHKLEVKIADSETADLNSNNSFKFTVNGNIEIAWKFNEDLFKDLVKGKNSSTYIEQVKNSFPKLEKTTFKVFPFWRNSVPSNEDKINIIINK